MREKIQEIVFNCTKDFFENSDYKLTTSIDKNFRLIGDSSPLDSMGLVSLIVEVEESINDDFDVELVLASEKAMSARTSPFINLETLIIFIEEELNLISE
jgi:acyl carrier protein